MSNISTLSPTGVNNGNAIIYSDFLMPFEKGQFKNLKYDDVNKSMTHCLTIQYRDVYPTSIDIETYDKAIEPIREHLNKYLMKRFKKIYPAGVVNLLQPNGPSMATVNKIDSHRSRRFEFEVILVPDMEFLFALAYSEGEITMGLGDLPFDEISTLLREIGAWEV